MKAQVLEARLKGVKTFVIGFKDIDGHIYKSLKTIDPIALKPEWVDTSTKAWNAKSRKEAELVLKQLSQYVHLLEP